ncbi:MULTISPECIES: hypothetical protein [unclassified Nostoc]|uniref:hypothetical protein n=1 Tax=unclassified Nostoc TaxID=2593658 RepID=UPI001D5A52BE|nr:hypothetical protein [Nostoc sp. JL23]MBN3877479.1 hypothetical protein [Nostoc sp. JL23]
MTTKISAIRCKSYQQGSCLTLYLPTPSKLDSYRVKLGTERNSTTVMGGNGATKKSDLQWMLGHILNTRYQSYPAEFLSDSG